MIVFFGFSITVADGKDSVDVVVEVVHVGASCLVSSTDDDTSVDCGDTGACWEGASVVAFSSSTTVEKRDWASWRWGVFR